VIDVAMSFDESILEGIPALDKGVVGVEKMGFDPGKGLATKV
jgi:hypothetical protein